jgi:ZIP family zinc transporter
MIEAFRDLHPVLQALVATCFTWAVTAAGAATVFAAKDITSMPVPEGILAQMDAEALSIELIEPTVQIVI